jgi:hypothetical protein
MANVQNFFQSRSWVNGRTFPAAGLIVSLILVAAISLCRVQQQLKTQREIVRTVCSLANLPAQTPPERLYAALAKLPEQCEEARRARIARVAGVEPDWPLILQRVTTLSAARKSEFYQMVTREYNLPTNWTQARIDEHMLNVYSGSYISDAVSMPSHLLRD